MQSCNTYGVVGFSRGLLLWGLPLLYILLAIPLVLQRVPPNGLYGVRVPASFKSPEAWYRINLVGGWLLIAVGAATFIVNMLIVRFVNKPNDVRELLYMAGVDWSLVVLTGIAIIILAPKW